MQQNLTITFNDGSTRVVKATAADFVAFESKFDLSIARLEKEVRLTHLLFLAWHCEHRTKATELAFDDWVQTIENVGMAETKK